MLGGPWLWVLHQPGLTVEEAKTTPQVHPSAFGKVTKPESVGFCTCKARGLRGGSKEAKTLGDCCPSVSSTSFLQSFTGVPSWVEEVSQALAETVLTASAVPAPDSDEVPPHPAPCGT